MNQLLWTGPVDSDRVLVLAHGAGAPMDSPWMDDMAALLADRGIRVARFEFAYMAARRSGVRKPPPRAERLLDEYLAAFTAADLGPAPAIGGKSLGGRVASMLADRLWAEGKISGLVCAGYPFHPPGSPEKLRVAHLEKLQTPALICQGERDPFGTAEEVASYALSPQIDPHWLPDGDHDFRPRRASGRTLADNIEAAADAIAAALRGWTGAA